MTEPKTLGSDLPKEIERVQRLFEIYQRMGKSSVFAASMLKLRLKDALSAMTSGDAVAMLRAYNDLRGCE